MRKTKSAYPTRGVSLLLGLLTLFWSVGASGGIHTWDIVEVYSNADGTIQYIELLDVGTGGGEINIGNATISSSAQSHSIANGPVTAPTNGKFYLIATPDFAALPGAPTPDEILPPTAVPFFDISGDTVSVGLDNLTFGSVPTNGTDALTRAGSVVANSPTNYAGATGSVTAPGPPGVPFSSLPALILMLLAIASTAWMAAGRKHPAPID
ncbi:MAG: hypothetical protein P8Q97_19035 [Myxococcota bacterium]|jgi:hypothetical protein|nr:hypothetical protein [Myxococcota bacterium]